MNRRSALLRALTNAGPRGITGWELVEAGCGTRYSARLAELRKEGFEVSVEREKEGVFRYKLLRVPGQSEAASEPEAALFAVQPPGHYERGVA